MTSEDLKMRILQVLEDARRLIVSLAGEHEHIAVDGKVVCVVRREIRQIDEALVSLSEEMLAARSTWDIHFDDPRTEEEFGAQIREQRRAIIEGLTEEDS